LKQLLVISD